MSTTNTIAPFSAQQVEASCLAMLEVARTDDIVPAEIELIRAFWEQAADQLGSFSAERAEAFNAGLFTSNEHKLLLIDMCIACAFADGKYSDHEKATLSSIASRLGLSADTLTERTGAIRASFLGALSHLPDTQSVAALAKELG